MKRYFLSLMMTCGIFIIGCSNLLAQSETKNNKWLVGNNFNYNVKNEITLFSGNNIIERNTELTEHRFKAIPFIGKKLNSNWLLGGGLSFTRIKREENSEEMRRISLIFIPNIGGSSNADTIIQQETINNTLIRTVSLGGFLRRYFRLKNHLQLFFQSSLHFSYSNNQNEERRFLKHDDNTTNELINFSNIGINALLGTLSFSPGLSWNFNKFNITAKYINLSYSYGKKGFGNLEVQNFSITDLDIGINSLLIGLEYKW